MNFKNLKIGKKLSLAFIIMLVFTLFTNIYTISNLRKSEKLNTELFEGPYQSTSESMGVRRDVVSIGRNIGNAMLEQNPAKYKPVILKDFDSLEKRVEILYKASSSEEAIIKELETAIDELKEEFIVIYDVLEKGDYKAAAQMTGDGSKAAIAYERCAQTSIKLNEDEEVRGTEFNQGIGKTVKHGTIVSIVICSINIICGIFICIFITRSLTNPIKEIEEASNQMAGGDFDIDIEYESNDELGSLSDSMRQMSYRVKEMVEDTVRVLEDVASGNFDVEPEVTYLGVFKNIEDSMVTITKDLSDTMTQINLAAEEVEAASNQVSSGSQMLAQGATEQASSVEELSVTINDISEKIQDTAINAKEANELSTSAGIQIKEGNEQMKQMIAAMEEISVTSNEIGRIIKTIDDIAFQTNILALNAAVEAARAGDAGKGFAVVADEVRNLAAKSAEAAKNTATLIENSIESVDRGTEIVDNTAKALQSIIDTTNRTATLVDSIAKASEEEAVAIAQVTSGVEQISSVVQTNSATSEESAAASQELSGQSHMLKTLMDNFKLKGDNNCGKYIDFDNLDLN
ncbi:methyl-accepting chemotaxis protein [Paraclostridium bifermentans]|uniref:methyl-accepting chemotaxis protein n=1 Tax=Paraclostridium bifermentans TaxID=1490 RepID=UPI00359C3A28